MPFGHLSSQLRLRAATSHRRLETRHCGCKFFSGHIADVSSENKEEAHLEEPQRCATTWLPHSKLGGTGQAGFQHECFSCTLAEKLNFSKRKPLAAPSPRVCQFKGVCFHRHPLIPPPSGTPTRRSTRKTRYAKRTPKSAKRTQIKHVL